jgi:hypothetical protein
MQRLIAQHRIRPRPHLSSRDEHEQRLYAVSQRLDRERDAILREALEDSLSHYETKVFGGLLATQQAPDEERPLVHARLLSESIARPLCGASDGPWSTRAFDFQHTTCHECNDILLNPES